MKRIMLVLMILLALNIVFAVDLSDYPSLLVEDGDFNAIIVVGDKASSYDAISQSLIAASLVRNLNKPLSGMNKLASEVSDINQNIITIGSPCVNEITAKIMGSPEPCGADFKEGKGYIRLIEANGYIYIIVAGKTDKDARRAAEALASHEKYDLEGNEYIAISPIIKDSSIEIPIPEKNQTSKEEQFPELPPEPDVLGGQGNADDSAKSPKAIGGAEARGNEEENKSVKQQANETLAAKPEQNQKKDKEECSADSECAGNKCTDGKCGYKKETRWARLISWIKGLFA